MNAASADDLAPTPRTTVQRVPQRGVYDREQIRRILDEALVCHVGFVDDGQPFVMPTIHARVGECLYIHGSPGSRMLRRLSDGVPACVTVTLLDGLVLARSAFHHSMNYRSVVIVGRGRAVEDAQEKAAALAALVEHVVPGRGREARPPNAGEMRATQVLGFAIEEASAKVRNGPPVDEAGDYDLPVWAGVLPLTLVPGEPQPDPRLRAGIAVPPGVSAYARPS